MIKETPSQLRFPAYLMNFPFSLDTSNPNNVWMKELDPKELEVNKEKAYLQFMDLYNFMAGSALVYLLPSYGDYQDQVYVANLGVYLPNITDSNNVVLSNFTSKPRQGEEKAGKPFFKLMNYETQTGISNQNNFSSVLPLKSPYQVKEQNRTNDNVFLFDCFAQIGFHNMRIS